MSEGIRIDVKGNVTSNDIIMGHLQLLQIFPCRVGGIWKVYVQYEINLGHNPYLTTLFSIVPGGGQMYRGETFKGVSFMLLSLGSLTGGFIFQKLSTDSESKAFSARKQTVIDFYNTESKNYHTYSTISFIVAAAFYAWSLIDLIDPISVKQNNMSLDLNYNQNLQVCFRYNF